MDLPATPAATATVRPAAPRAARERDDGAGRLERRGRILDAASALASQGGYDAVQMRAVARQASVALGTVYRYYPSKVQVLVATFARELERTRDRIDRIILRGDTSYDRLVVLANALTKSLHRDPRLTGALVRAYLFADGPAAVEAGSIADLLDRMFGEVLGNTGRPSAEQTAVARLVSDVWLVNLAAWATGRSSATETSGRVHLTIALLVGEAPGP